MPGFFSLALTTDAVKSLFTNFRDDPPGRIIHEPGLVNNGASRVKIAKQVARSREKRGSPPTLVRFMLV